MEQLLQEFGAPAIIVSIVTTILLVIAAIREVQNSFATIKKLANWIKGIKEKFAKKKAKRKKLEKTIASVETLLADINQHYSKDNISKRDEWINWVNGQADTYNSTLENINERLGSLDKKLEKTTNLAEKTRLDQQRQSILDFAARVNNPQYDYSKEHFRKVFKTIEEYEAYIEANNLINGEIDHAIEVIEKAYAEKKNSGKIVW